MKKTVTVWLMDPAGYIKFGKPYFIYSDTPGSEYFSGQGYIPLAEVEIEFHVDEKMVVLAAIESLDEKETGLREQFNKKLREIESARNDLKALTYQGVA